LRAAVQTKSLQRMVDAYDHALDNSTILSDRERKLLQLAQQFLAAQSNDDDEALAAAYEELRQHHFPLRVLFTQEEAKRGQQAQERQKALTRFRKALAQPGVQAIVYQYDSI